MNNISELIKKYWSLVNTQKLIDQTPASPSYVYAKYFAGNLVSKESKNITVYIKKGKDLVLTSLGGSDDRSVIDRDSVYELSLKIPRFALTDHILADEMNEFKSLDGEANVLEALSKKIGDISKSHKNSYMTTLSFMSIGALFGEVSDGEGKVLFSFKNTATPIDFKSTIKIIESLNNIDDALVDEFGIEVAYEILCSRTFLSGVAILAQTENLFEQGQAKWEDRDNKRVLIVHGVAFIPFTAKRKNEKGADKTFIANSKAIVVPINTQDTFQTFYTRANHPQAIGAVPTQFFMSSPKETDKGYKIDTEMVAITICTRPGALIPLVYS